MSTKTKFYTAYGEKRKTVPCCCGNRMEPHFVERYDEKGHPYLVKDGETDTYAIIQSHKEECDIMSMLTRYAAGDTSVMRPDAKYIDTSELPTTVHEYFNLMNAQREKFNALPVEIKQKFENSFEVWASTSGTAEWLDKMGMNQQPKEVKEVKPENGES